MRPLILIAILASAILVMGQAAFNANTGRTNSATSAPATVAGITVAANTPGSAVIVGYAAQTGQTMNISAATLFATGSNSTLYHFFADVDCTTTSAAAVVTVSLKFTDTSNTVQTIASGNAACTALGAASLVSFDYTFQAKNGTNIQYLTTITNTPTYDVRVAVTQLGTN